MARNTKTTTEAVETEAVETETPEVEAVETETPEVEFDLTAFLDAVAKAMEVRDPSTGSVPEANIAAVREAYQALPGIKPKNAAKSVLTEALAQAVDSMVIEDARAIQSLLANAAVAGKSAASTRKPVDPAQAFVDHLGAVTLAYYLASNAEVEGVDLADAQAKATALAQEAFEEAKKVQAGEAETGSRLIKAAVRIATPKAPSGGRTTGSANRSIEAHIRSAFADLPVGSFLSKNDIRKHRSEEYGDTVPSSGAISNRVSPKDGSGTTLKGFETVTQDGRVGLVKTAD